MVFRVNSNLTTFEEKKCRSCVVIIPELSFSIINCLKLWIKMEQNDSSSTYPENGLNMQPALSPDEDFVNLIKLLLDPTNDTTKEQKKEILAKRCPKFSKINFTKVMNLFPEYNHLLSTDVLLAIISNATNLSNFQIMDGSANITLSRVMSEEMLSAIAKMSKLKILKVRHFSISFSSLMKLCRNLPSLKTLFFKIKAEPNFKIYDMKDFQKSFGHLEKFQFSLDSIGSGWEVNMLLTLTLNCILYLPNLRLLGDPGYFVDMLPTCLCYESLAIFKQSKLGHLAIYMDRNIKEKALSKFPEVGYMHIYWANNQKNKQYQVPGLLEFKNLTMLLMSDLGPKYSVYINRFLQVYGKHLTRLMLEFESHPIDFIWLFNLICCNSFDCLSGLVMSNLFVQPFTVQLYEKRILCNLNCEKHQHFYEFSCKSLKELELEFASKQTFSQAYVHLSKILSVPNLENVKLIRVPTTLDELRKTVDLVTKRSILKKVYYFVLELSNEQMIEKEIVERTKCCQTIKEEMLSDKKEGEIFRRSFVRAYVIVATAIEFLYINCLKLWIKMEQIDSSSTNPENGLNLQPTLSNDDDTAGLIKKLFASKDEESIEKTIEMLVENFSNLTKINFAKVMDIFPSNDSHSLTMVLLAIASKATNMSDFQIIDESATRQKFTLRSMSEEMVSAIAKMTKLKILKVRHFSISFSSLMELCGMLPSLKILYFKIEAEPNFKIVDLDVFQKSFGHLRKFLFSSVSKDRGVNAQFRQRLTLECISCFPNLRFLGDRGTFVDMLPTCLEINELTEDEWKSKLRHLALYLDRDVQENVLTKFPDVEQMHIWVENDQLFSGYQLPGLLKFQNLSQLFMSNLGRNFSAYMKRFLEVYGERLTHLVLQFNLKSGPIDLDSFFNMICCSSFHNLNMLVMKNLDVQPSTLTVEGESGDCVAHNPQFGNVSYESLKHLGLIFVSKQSSNPTHVHLSKILSVPNLENVKLIRVPATLGELWNTMLLVTKRTILKKVTHFELELSNEQMIEREIDARIKCCETIKNELLSDKEKGEIFRRVLELPQEELRKISHANSHLITSEGRSRLSAEAAAIDFLQHQLSKAVDRNGSKWLFQKSRKWIELTACRIIR
ncbi:Hypothetical predicted protein [Cloeon dipterum]|uniref:Uncharacterized protein n=1 Tax=Cloeon dipterum TaxID=197152 RepID=A0A8S1C8E5_9INSE|nr:Hypothetical predicted protein [Cloeon dipterum]